MSGMTRRQVLMGGTAGTLGLATGARAAGRAWAQQKELIANTYGGGWEQGHRQAIAEPLEKKTGAKVVLVSILANELVARTKAAAGSKPPVDVALVDDGPFLNAIKEDVFLKLPMEKIPNAARLYPQYRPKEPYGVPIGASVIGIAYNAKKLKTAPASWADLWKPEYKGRVGLCTPASTLGTVALLAFAKAKGGGETRIEPGFDAVKSLLPSVGSIASSPAALQTLLERGEVDIAPMWHSNTLILKGKGTGMEFVLPKEGGMAGLAWFAVTKAGNLDLALAYINQGLSPESQTLLARPPFFFGPTVQGIKVDPELRGVVPAAPEDLKRLIQIDWSLINPARPEWINHWNREIKV
jgi:putative spermidine/putrescine transport system substrate-binding protein